MSDDRYVLRIRIELLGTDPPIWRRILVPENYSFWDLHVAIQDAMGWEDSHLHVFRFIGTETAMGIPFEDGDDPFETRRGWQFPMRKFLSYRSPIALYEYDLGDSWLHEVRLEDAELAEPGASYPRCVAGARRCPPEDVGGVHRYAEFVRAMADRTHPEHETFAGWIGGPYDAEHFDPAAVRFDDPKERWHRTFEEVDG